MAIFKVKKGKIKTIQITPELAKKIAEKAIIRKPSFDDCLRDISARSEMGYRWTYMLQIHENVIDELKEKGWSIKILNNNISNDTNFIKISW